MSPDKVITQIISQVDATLFLLLLKLFAVGVIALILKNKVENLSAYLIFRFNVHVGVGTWVEIYGRRGQIIEASMSTVTVEAEDGFLRIPMKAWRGSKYVVLKK